MNAKATPTNNIDYSCHVIAIGSISCYTMPLVIDNLDGTHTHITHTHIQARTHTYTCIHTRSHCPDKTNQVSAGLWQSCTWFKNFVTLLLFPPIFFLAILLFLAYYAQYIAGSCNILLKV